MLEKLIGDLGKDSSMETFYFWKFASEHPYLHTLVKISDSLTYVVVFFGAYYLIKRIMKKKV